jgi:single-stranded-DNA-specific exonuclease
MKLPNQRWRIASTNSDRANELALNTGLLPLLTQTLVNRGVTTPELARVHIEPEWQDLPLPLEEFRDLALSVALLKEAIATQDKIAICGDYDADGMTSTALLLRALRYLGADVDYAIPSRMKDGYGINTRIVEEFASAGVGIVLTVDNGISAREPVARAVALGMSVIITDHHDLPVELPNAHAILNPKLLRDDSPYQGLAGVGVAYILATTLAQDSNKLEGLTESLLELFTLGTIADLAPLVGVNRRWLKQGLKLLPKSQLAGVQALMLAAGVSDAQKQLKPDDIGFRLGPRINAIGRIGDPQTVIELLTTDDPGLAYGRAMQCEETNTRRQKLCEQIEKEAIAQVEKTPIPWRQDRVLVVVKSDWHHGVIGIVASRLVERYGVPVFIATQEENGVLRGSARGIEEFNVFEALEFCRDCLGKFGGHKAAGGFSLPAANLATFKQKLSQFAHQCLEPEHLKPLVKIDAEATFAQLTPQLHEQIENLQPWGIGNDFPVFWTREVRVKEQKVVGNNHLKISLEDKSGKQIKAIAWRWGDYFPLPSQLNLAYKLRENAWNGNKSLELELVGVRLSDSLPSIRAIADLKTATFEFKGRSYICSLLLSLNELKIQNEQGKVLTVNRGKNLGFLQGDGEGDRHVDLSQPHYCELVEAAFTVLKS